MNRKLRPDDKVIFSETLRRRAIVRKVSELGVLIKLQDMQFPLEINHEIWVARRDLRIEAAKK